MAEDPNHSPGCWRSSGKRTLKAPISACLIVRDEAEKITACLASLEPYVEELAVVDTGSRDATLDLARAGGARVSTFTWNNNFAEARNAAIAQATQPYILMVDADEVLDSESAPALLQYCAAQPSAAGRVTVVNVGVGPDGAETEFPLTRLFPNRLEYRYTGRIHEQLLCRGNAPEHIRTGIRLIHSGYTDAAVRQRGKIERNLDLLRRALEDAPGDPYTLFQLGRTCALARRTTEAATHFSAALTAIADGSERPIFLPSLLLESAYTSMRLADHAAAMRLLELGLELYPDFTDLYFACGTVLLDAADSPDMEAVRQAFEACVTLGEADGTRYETQRGVGSFRAYHNLGLYYELTGDVAGARKHFAAAASAGFAPSSVRLAALQATAQAA